MKKVLKDFTNGNLSVKVTKIEQEEEIVSERPMNPNENFETFHTPIIPNTTNEINPNSIGSYTKNVQGFGITITRKLK